MASMSLRDMRGYVLGAAIFTIPSNGISPRLFAHIREECVVFPEGREQVNGNVGEWCGGTSGGLKHPQVPSCDGWDQWIM